MRGRHRACMRSPLATAIAQPVPASPQPRQQQAARGRMASTAACAAVQPRCVRSSRSSAPQALGRAPAVARRQAAAAVTCASHSSSGSGLILASQQPIMPPRFVAGGRAGGPPRRRRPACRPRPGPPPTLTAGRPIALCAAGRRTWRAIRLACCCGNALCSLAARCVAARPAASRP